MESLMNRYFSLRISPRWNVVAIDSGQVLAANEGMQDTLTDQYGEGLVGNKWPEEPAFREKSK